MTTQHSSHIKGSAHHRSHHHHHHNEDSASKFKRSSFNSIRRRKLMRKWGLIALTAIAILMFIAVFVVYTTR